MSLDKKLLKKTNSSVAEESPKEIVKADFNLEIFNQGQMRAWELLLSLAGEIEIGMTENEAVEIYKQLQVEAGAEKYWHPPKIRFGVNTLCSFREPSDPLVKLKENDIFFLDIGPIFDGYEADVGKTFVCGEFAAADRIQLAGEQIYQMVAVRYNSTLESGAELYKYAANLAIEAGYELVGDGARGHRVSDFPHAAYYKGHLNDLERHPTPNRWILEIQLRDQKNKIGAFFEDVLTTEHAKIGSSLH